MIPGPRLGLDSGGESSKVAVTWDQQKLDELPYSRSLTGLVSLIPGLYATSLDVGGSSFGVAAWFPLGPREVYRPSYHVSEFYVRQVNITHVTNVSVTNVTYVNQRVPGAVVAVPHEAFVSARPVSRAAVRLEKVWCIGFSPRALLI